MSETPDISLLDSIELVDVMGSKPDSVENLLETPPAAVVEKVETTESDEKINKPNPEASATDDQGDPEGVNSDKTNDLEKIEDPNLKENTKDDGDTEKNIKDAADSDPDSEAPSIISTVKESLGYDVEGDFSNDVEGLIGLTKQVIPKAAEEMVSQMLNEYPRS